MKQVSLFSSRLVTGIVLLINMAHGQDLPKVIQPSPSTSALFRFVDYPMDYSTGLPQISIPIYEIKSGSLSVPISISNHASGRRVSDQNGPIALGWSLNAGGIISRTVYGSPDFGTIGSNYPFPVPFNIKNIHIANDLAYLERITHFENNPDLSPPGTWLDSEYDIFSYSFNGLSGKFIFKDSNNIKVPTFLPYKPYKVATQHANGLSVIEITDDAGIQYRFNATESYTSNQHSINSAFALKSMISADKTDTIEFEYAGFYEERKSINQQTILNDNINVSSQGNPFLVPELQNNESKSTDSYQTSRLAEIRFKLGRVVFNFLDGTDKIANIQIKNLKNETIKTVEVNRSHLESLSEMQYALFKLDGLTFKDKAGAAIENYSFAYYPTVFVSPATQIDVRHRDWWGYYNASGQHDMVPYYSNLEYQYNGTTPVSNSYRLGNPSYGREPDLNALKSGMLKKITYPTGGSTEFIYENNKYLSRVSNMVKFGPGLRIAQLKTDDNNGTTSYKIFKYGTLESGYGAIDVEPQLSTMATQNFYNYLPTFESPLAGEYRQRIFYSGFIPELSALGDRPVIYNEVAEYNGTETNNAGKSIYNYDYYAWGAATMPSSVYGQIPKMHIYDFNYWNSPSLIKKTDYERIDQGGVLSYIKQKEQVNHYSANTTEYVKGLHVQKVHIFTQDGKCVGGLGKYPEEEGVKTHNVRVYSFNEYRIPLGYKNLTSTEETLYASENRSIKSTVAYEYNAHQHLSRTIANTSDGSNVINEVRYPYDLIWEPVYSEISVNMVNRNMLNIPIQQSEYKDLLHLKSTKTKYKHWGKDLIAPQWVEARTLNNPFEVRLRYHEYDDQANIRSVSKEGDVRQSYLWGYNKEYPVAQVTGADYAAISSLVNLSVIEDPQSSEQQVRDELRNIYTAFAGKKVLVNTYTYKPLVGMTSQTDVNENATYYTYDDYGRLMLIQDNDRNILRKMCYSYNGQQQSCEVNTTAQWEITGNYRCVTNANGEITGYQEKELRDVNSNSLTYNQTKWLDNGYNPTSCQKTIVCDYTSCDAQGDSFKCINGRCEQGFRVNTDSYFDSWMGVYICTYHYEFSDGSWSSNYAEYNSSSCLL